MTDCTCKVGPNRTTFDPDCHFHGREGTMVVTIRETRKVLHNRMVGAMHEKDRITPRPLTKEDLADACLEALGGEDLTEGDDTCTCGYCGHVHKP